MATTQHTALFSTGLQLKVTIQGLSLTDPTLIPLAHKGLKLLLRLRCNELANGVGKRQNMKVRIMNRRIFYIQLYSVPALALMVPQQHTKSATTLLNIISI